MACGCSKHNSWQGTSERRTVVRKASPVKTTTTTKKVVSKASVTVQRNNWTRP